MNESSRRGALRHVEDRRAVGLAAGHLALVVATVATYASGAPAAWFILTTALLAASSFVQLISVHNAMHAPLFWNKRANRAWQCALSICIGYPVSIYVPVHNLSHHLGLQTPRDVLRTTEVRHRSNLLNLVDHMVAGTVHLHLLHFAYLARLRQSRPRWVSQVLLEGACVAVFFVAIALAVGPLGILFVWLPNIMGQLLMVGFGYVQHDGCDHDSEHAHSRNFTSPLLNWFICDNGWHAVHHDRPGLHWTKLRTAHAKIVGELHPALDQRSLTAYMWRTFVWPGRRLRYDGAPVVLPPQRAKRELWTPDSAIDSGASSGAVEG